MMTTGTTNIVTEITQQIDRLIAARALLMTGETLPPARPASPTSHISIVDSMGERTIHEVTHTPHQPAKPAKAQSAKAIRPRQPRKLSAAARQRISEAQAKRWRKFHRERRQVERVAAADRLAYRVEKKKKAQVA